MRKLAKRIGLVDKPNKRKLHNGANPLSGRHFNLSSFSAILSVLDLKQYKHSWLYVACIASLTLIGAIDDKVDLSFKIRMGVQGSTLHYYDASAWHRAP